MKKLLFAFSLVVVCAAWAFAAEKSVQLDDFEGVISGGAEGTVDFGAGNGSAVEVTATPEQAHGGKQSLKVVYDAVSGGYMYIAKGTKLDAKKADWKVKPEDVNWKEFNAISVWVFGADSKETVAIDVKDNGGEIWRSTFVDDFKGWKQIAILFNEFKARDDWQPDSADKNGTLDFPVRSYQFEPLTPGKGVLYFDDVEIIQK
ncbi:MAG TPA: carbohydrate binding domain-containing protein [Candidatus Omnitrophota bacterium]|nr:carbohydrate binding domain-containing protein [Candidatus Omnitrophota bacterium]HPT07047.1 carbohydrate binding domain-containing protein [Candidatus Omnitrophota bacterium]